ncbi:MAG TPA: sugar phosphate nucleotidyltransferase [Candidatus Binatia bacterium]
MAARLLYNSHAMKDIEGQERCGIVLAGAKDARLRGLIHYLRGSAVPKQYVNFIGTRSMIEHAFDRTERLVRRECLFAVVTREHLSYPEVERQLALRPAGTVLVQPDDRDTGLGILLALAHIHKRRPASVVAVFPADHFVSEEELFMTQVAMAFYIVENNPSEVILLGVEPDSAEVDYDYILADGDAESSAAPGARRVRLLVEKPDAALAHELVASAALWNTTTMVFRTDTAIDLVRRFSSELYGAFQEIHSALGTRSEKMTIDTVYRRMKPRCFAHEVLQKCALANPRVRVLPVSGVFWSDWGSEPRVVESLKMSGYFDRLQITADKRAQLG